MTSQEEIRLWEKRFAELRKHVQAEYSFALLPSHTLYRWVVEQRTAGMQGKLSQERREKLDSIGFLFTVDPRPLADQEWNLHLEALRQTVVLSPGYYPDTRKRVKRSRLDRWVLRQLAAVHSGSLQATDLSRLTITAPHVFAGLKGLDRWKKKAA